MPDMYGTACSTKATQQADQQVGMESELDAEQTYRNQAHFYVGNDIGIGRNPARLYLSSPAFTP